MTNDFDRFFSDFNIKKSDKSENLQSYELVVEAENSGVEVVGCHKYIDKK